MTGLVVDVGVRRGDLLLDAEFDVPSGTTTALLGPNGAGKSTLIDVVAGLLEPDRGVVELNGRRLDDVAGGVWVPPEQRSVGVVFQRYLLFSHLDVRDNVAFGLRSRGIRRSEARRRAEEWLGEVGAAELAGLAPRELSGGQAQRVALARALAIEPDALLLDEPLAAVDVEARARLRRLLRSRVDAFTGPRLLVTHDPTDAMLLADQVVVLEAGRVVQRGTPEAIRRHPATPYVAALAGTNLAAGVKSGNLVTLNDHGHVVTVADDAIEGDVLVVIPPQAVALHGERPGGSPRNSWTAVVEDVEPLGATTRVTLGVPLPLAVDVTPASVEALGVRVGVSIWASVKATEIDVVGG